MSELITPDELPRWVPGELTLDSAPLGWDGVRIRGYRYGALDVPIPGTQDYLVVAYQGGATAMNRRCTGDWCREQVAPGSISLLTRAAQSHWRWSDDIEVTHLYLSVAALADVAAQAYERNVRDIELLDVLRTEDPILSAIVGSLAREFAPWGAGRPALRGLAEELGVRPYAAALRQRELPSAGDPRRALARTVPFVNPICRRQS